MRGLLLIAFLSTISASAQTSGGSIFGDWRDPTGSVIEISNCGNTACAKIAAVGKQAPSPYDIHNPDVSARKHPLCGLQIGYGFHLSDPTHADGGRLYDPKSGKTYKGTMTAEGNQLHLRGYVGIKAFGRSETWARVGHNAATCPVR